MPFIPHTKADTKAMLAAIDVDAISDLFDEIPSSLLIDTLKALPEGLNEMALARLMQERAGNMPLTRCFIGAGAYEHHIPSVVWDLASRGEYLTGYTPYQAEASQGTLQVLWEYQTMIASLMGLEISNASLHDGSTALTEALLMACRLSRGKKGHTIWVPQTVNPFYRQVLKSLLSPQGIDIVTVPFDEKTGIITIDALEQCYSKNPVMTALVVPLPNFFGLIENVHELTDWAKAKGAKVIGVVNPLACAWLTPPGQWGESGADIACGEAQPLGVPLSGGGPYLGFLACNKESLRQLPGRLVGRTLDQDGQLGYTLTLQAREQHIRRQKATSNICTNQGLLVTAATIYMSLMGPQGLKQIAKTCHERTQCLNEAIQAIPGCRPRFATPYFHETLWQLPVDVDPIISSMLENGVACGFKVQSMYTQPSLKNTLLVCATETKTDEDIALFAQCLQHALESVKGEAVHECF